MNKTLSFFLFLLCFNFSLLAQSKFETNFEKLKQYYNLLKLHYVDTVDFERIVESAIIHSLENLDPYSSYLPPI